VGVASAGNQGDLDRRQTEGGANATDDGWEGAEIISHERGRGEKSNGLLNVYHVIRMIHRGARDAWSKAVTSEQPCACGTPRAPALARARGGIRYGVILFDQRDG
jgi:hypothetical protein